MQWTYRKSPQNLKSSYYGPKRILDFSPTNSSHGNSKCAQLLQFTPFYAVTGAQMLLPQLMVNTENTETVTQNFTRELHKTMAKFDLTDFSNREKLTKKSYVPDQLQTCDKVWIRIDRVRKPLEAPYSGPYMVLERTPKYFLIEN